MWILGVLVRQKVVFIEGGNVLDYVMLFILGGTNEMVMTLREAISPPPEWKETKKRGKMNRFARQFLLPHTKKSVWFALKGARAFDLNRMTYQLWWRKGHRANRTRRVDQWPPATTNATITDNHRQSSKRWAKKDFFCVLFPFKCFVMHEIPLLKIHGAINWKTKRAAWRDNLTIVKKTHCGSHRRIRGIAQKKSPKIADK
jgi:hypothetical protein